MGFLMVKQGIKDMQVEERNRIKNVITTSGKPFHLGYFNALAVVNSQFRNILAEYTLPPVRSPAD